MPRSKLRKDLLTLSIALIGMSFLKHVEMRRSGNTMTLSRPNY